MPGYNGGEIVILTDNRVCLVVSVIIANVNPTVAHYQVLVVAEALLINVHGNEISGVAGSDKEMAVASIIRKKRALLTAVGTQPSAFLQVLLTASNQANPVIAFHGLRGDSNLLDHTATGSVSNTARSMFLDRFARMPGKKGMSTLRYSMLEGADNYLWCLGLDAQIMESWRGQTILDLGCGYSIFYAEAWIIFGVNIVPIDTLVRDPAVVNSVVEHYVRNMCFLKALFEFSSPQACGMEDIEIELFDRAFGRMAEIVQHYRNNAPQKLDIITGDLSQFNYSGVVSCYLFCYFSPEQKLAALVNICKHMKKPGWLRICTGMQGISVSTLGIADDVLDDTATALSKNSIAISTEQKAEFIVITVTSKSLWSYFF